MMKSIIFLLCSITALADPNYEIGYSHSLGNINGFV